MGNEGRSGGPQGSKSTRCSEEPPVVLLLVGVLVVTRPSTLIDVIRARDEAAKDANRLLAELSGRLMTLEIAVYRWRKQLLATRELLIQEWLMVPVVVNTSGITRAA